MMAIRQFVKFTVGEEEFGVEISKVREIIKIQEMLKVPNAPRYIEGLMNLRGTVLTIYNLRKRLGMHDKEFDENSKIITVYHNDLLVGFTVDMVNEIVRVDEENIEDTPSSVPNIDKKFLSKVVKFDNKLMLILDLTNVLSPDEETEIREFISKNEEQLNKQ
ncbi:MAG TPA: chemotaxis protein CheW [Thermoclostridium sp.]